MLASNHRIEELRQVFRNYSKEQQIDMLELTNRIASLSQDLDDSQKERLLLEQQVDKARQDDSQHSLQFGRILMSVESVMVGRRMVSRSNHSRGIKRSRYASSRLSWRSRDTPEGLPLADAAGPPGCRAKGRAPSGATNQHRNGPSAGALDAESLKRKNNPQNEKICWSRNMYFSHGFAPYFACAKL